LGEHEIQQLRVLIANERRDRLELLAQVVAGLGHEVIAGDEELRGLLEGAGLGDVELLRVAFKQPLAGTDALWEGILGGSVNTRAILLAQPLVIQERIRIALEHLAEPHRREDGLDVPVSIRIASAGRR
jgi:hypothetical protein